MKRLLLAFSLLFIVVLGLGYHFFHQFKQEFCAPGSLKISKIVLVPSGVGLNRISEVLAQEGIIRDAFVFLWGVRFQGKARELKAGEFEFQPLVSPEEVMNILISGRTYTYKFTVAEGLTTEEILREIHQIKVLEGDILKLPNEGDLLPETYHFTRGYSRQSLVKRMRESKEAMLENLWKNRSPDCPFKTKEEALIIASIVEKETGLPEERPLIAAVFINRLKKKMMLQSDPTISYILHKEQGRPLNQGLSKEDLKYNSPFNTYLNAGLPPAPICNPGKESLIAVFYPKDSEVLYFVANGKGGHTFSSSLKNHQKNHAHWRKVRKELKEAQVKENS